MKLTRIFVFLTFMLYGATIVPSMNLLHPHEIWLQRLRYDGYPFRAFYFMEFGLNSRGFNNCERVNPLAIWSPNQNALSMLSGFCPDSPMGQKLLAVDATDDGTRGHLLFQGCLDLHHAGCMELAYFFNEQVALELYIPFYSVSLKNLQWTDLTGNQTAADVRVKELLTNDFCANTADFNLAQLCNWSRKGVGDLLLLSRFMFDFPTRQRPLLKKAHVQGRIGLTFPTGKKQDENRILALPFGSDATVGILLGATLELTLGECIRTGVDIELYHVFGTIACRRIKTDLCQTEFLLPAQAPVYKDFGLAQKFTLYIEWLQAYWDTSLLLGYQFNRHAQDRLTVVNQCFSSSFANSSVALDEWTLHQVLFNLWWSPTDWDDTYCFKPYASFFGHFPVNGKRAFGFSALGFNAGIDF